MTIEQYNVQCTTITPNLYGLCRSQLTSSYTYGIHSTTYDNHSKIVHMGYIADCTVSWEVCTVAYDCQCKEGEDRTDKKKKTVRRLTQGSSYMQGTSTYKNWKHLLEHLCHPYRVICRVCKSWRGCTVRRGKCTDQSVRCRGNSCYNGSYKLMSHTFRPL